MTDTVESIDFTDPRFMPIEGKPVKLNIANRLMLTFIEHYWCPEGDGFPAVREIDIAGTGEMDQVSFADAAGIPAALHTCADQVADMLADAGKIGPAEPAKAPVAIVDAHSHPVPTWAVDTNIGYSGSGDRYAWASHQGSSLELVLPGPDGEVVVCTRQLSFFEDTEPEQHFLRVTATDADGDPVDRDLTLDEVDALISNASAWVAGLRAQRALMGGGE